MAEKAKYWVGVCYPENMIDNWQEVIGEVLMVPYCYCLHDKDHLSEYNKKKNIEEEERKKHVHIMLAFTNTTTYNHALSTLLALSKQGCACLNKVEVVRHVRNKYEYLIHNTDDSRKKGKYLYPLEERISGNNFDIGSYEQITLADKNKMAMEICQLIKDNEIHNFIDLFEMVSGMGLEYFDILKSYSGLFDRMCNGNYQRKKYGNLDLPKKSNTLTFTNPVKELKVIEDDEPYPFD